MCEAEIGASKKKSHNLKIYGQFHCGIAHFQKEKDKSVYEVEIWHQARNT